MQALKNIPNNIDFGGQRNDIGTHSNRKGSATFALSVCMAVYLRAGWSIGNILKIDTYIQVPEVIKLLVGQFVVHQYNLWILQLCHLHFSNEDVEMISNVIGWENILEHYPNGFKMFIPYLLASITYHYHSGFLTRNLS